METIYELKLETDEAVYILKLTATPKTSGKSITVDKFDAMTKEAIEEACKDESFVHAVGEMLLSQYLKGRKAKRRL